MSELTINDALAAPAKPVTRAVPLRVLIWRRFLRHRLAVVAMVVLGLVIASALLAPLSRVFAVTPRKDGTATDSTTLDTASTARSSMALRPRLWPGAWRGGDMGGLRSGFPIR